MCFTYRTVALEAHCLGTASLLQGPEHFLTPNPILNISTTIPVCFYYLCISTEGPANPRVSTRAII